jgi:hypothetical protein
MNGERMRGHDPLVGGLQGELRRVQKQLYQTTARPPSKWYRMKSWPSIRLVNKWLDYVLVAVPMALLTPATLLFIWSFPWREPGQDQQTVVAACASVVALGGIIAGALSVPVSRAVDLGPGLTTGLIRSPRLWLPPLLAAPVTVFLFWLASHRPDDDAALASAFLAGGAYAFYWAATRNALAAADLMRVEARERHRLLRTLRRFMDQGEQLARATMAKDLPPDAQDVVVAAFRAHLAAPPIRQLCSTARRLFSQGATDAGFMFCTAMLGGLDFLAKENEGAIGEYNGLPGTVLESLENFVGVAMSHHDDYVAVQLVDRMAALAVYPYRHPHAAALRVQTRGRLVRVLERTWEDQNSRVPPSVAVELGALPGRLMALRADDDAFHALSMLKEVVLKAHVTPQAHIAGPAMSGFIDMFAVALAPANWNVRRQYLNLWKQEAKPIASLRALPHASILRPVEQLLPGLSMGGGTQMQQVLLTLPAFPDALPDAAETLYDLLREMTPAFAVSDQRPSVANVEAALALLLCVGQVVVHLREGLAPDMRERLAEQHLRVTVGWTRKIDRARASALVQWDGVAAHVWSNLLTGGCIAEAKEPLVNAAEALADRLVVDGDWARTQYLANFLGGLTILSGKTFPAQEDVRDAPVRMGGGYRHPGGRGTVPACTPALAHIDGVERKIDRWAHEAFATLAPE